MSPGEDGTDQLDSQMRAIAQKAELNVLKEGLAKEPISDEAKAALIKQREMLQAVHEQAAIDAQLGDIERQQRITDRTERMQAARDRIAAGEAPQPMYGQGEGAQKLADLEADDRLKRRLEVQE